MRKTKLFLFLILFPFISYAQETLLPINPPQTTNTMALAIYNKLPLYAEAAKMPWPPIKKNDVHVKTLVRKRLALLGIDYPDAFIKSVRTFQSQNDLKVTGKINKATLDSLNKSPVIRYNELVKSMEAWSQFPEDDNSRYILVNIPQFKMRLIDHGKEVLTMKVIVGRPSRPTPLLTSKITTIVFNPTWTVPKTILERDVIPGMRENRNYMKEHYDMHIYKSERKNAPEISPRKINWHKATIENFDYRVTAPPSNKNPLGRVKFIFENDQDVYMHDTPEKGIFDLNDRARSSGCIRLQDPMALVQYFFNDSKDLNARVVQRYLSTFKTKYVDLRNPMPVYIVYIPNWVDEKGGVHFASDIYADPKLGETAEMKTTIA